MRSGNGPVLYWTHFVGLNGGCFAGDEHGSWCRLDDRRRTSVSSVASAQREQCVRSRVISQQFVHQLGTGKQTPRRRSLPAPHWPWQVSQLKLRRASRKLAVQETVQMAGDTTENPGGGREPGGGDPAAAAQRARYGNSQAQWGGMIGKSSTDGGPGYSFDSIPLVADTPGLAQAGQKDDQTHRALVAQMALKLGQRTTGRSTWCPGPSSLWTT